MPIDETDRVDAGDDGDGLGSENADGARRSGAALAGNSAWSATLAGAEGLSSTEIPVVKVSIRSSHLPITLTNRTGIGQFRQVGI